MKKIVCLFVCYIFAGTASAVVIDFEGVAPQYGLVNISPTNTYTEGGFTLTPTNNQSAVFDAQTIHPMIGNASDWFGFAEMNTVSLTSNLSGTFDLLSILVGPTFIGGTITTDLLITGNVFGGGILTSNLTNLTTATSTTLGWTNLLSVTFLSSYDTGLDNINVSVSTVPEPAPIALLSLGLVGLGLSRIKKAK